jgi:hypothetical protein
MVFSADTGRGNLELQFGPRLTVTDSLEIFSGSQVILLKLLGTIFLQDKPAIQLLRKLIIILHTNVRFGS